MPYTHSLEIILYDILEDFVHETKFYGVEIFTCGMQEYSSKTLDLEDFRSHKGAQLLLCLFPEDNKPGVLLIPQPIGASKWLIN